MSIQAAGSAAQNEALNNYLSTKDETDKAAAKANCTTDCATVENAYRELSDSNNASLASCLAHDGCSIGQLAVVDAQNEYASLQSLCATPSACTAQQLSDLGQLRGIFQTAQNGITPSYDLENLAVQYIVGGAALKAGGSVLGAAIDWLAGKSAVTSIERGAGASASSSIPTAGDVDLAGVYSSQVQGVATDTPTALQQATNLFSSNAPGTVQIGESTFTELPNSGNAAIFSGATDAQVQQYFLELSGASEMPVARTIPGQGTIYVVKTPQGNFTLRDFAGSSAQTGSAWTIDVPGATVGKTYNPEIKFLR